MHRAISFGWQFFREVLVAEANPRGLSWGISLGLLLGVLPKSNLTAVAVLVTLFVARVNLAASLFTGLLVSLFSYHLDPLFHAIGEGWLTLAPLQPLLRRFFSLPIVAWTHWNNTVVAGSLMMGLALLWPTQRCLQRYFAVRLPHIRRPQRKEIVLNPVPH